MTKRTIAKIPISPGTPVRVEDFKYVDQGLEWNMQNEYDLRDDHLQASRVINWEIFGELALGLDGWTPGDSLLLEAISNELWVNEGLAYIGGRSYVLSADMELFDGETPGTNDYNIYLKYTLASDEFAYEYTTSTRTDDHLIKYLLLGTAHYESAVWSSVVDKRASNTALGAPATVSGADSGPIFTVENTDSGLGLLVRLSGAQIGEDGTPQILTIWGTSTAGLTLKESGTTNTIVLSCDAAGRMKVTGDINITGTITSGTWQGAAIADAYVASNITLDNLTQITTSLHSDLTGGIGTKTHATIDTHIDTTNIHYTQSNITTVGTIGSGIWQGTQIDSTYLVDVSQPLHSGSSPTFAGLTLTGGVSTNDDSFETVYCAVNTHSSGGTIITDGSIDVPISGTGRFAIPVENKFFEQAPKIDELILYYNTPGSGSYFNVTVQKRLNTSASRTTIDSASQVGNGLSGNYSETFILDWDPTGYTLWVLIDTVVGGTTHILTWKIVWST